MESVSVLPKFKVLGSKRRMYFIHFLDTNKTPTTLKGFIFSQNIIDILKVIV